MCQLKKHSCYNMLQNLQDSISKMITCLLLPGCFFLETSWQGNTGFFTMEVIPVVRKEPTNPITSKTHQLYHHEGDVEDTVKCCGKVTTNTYLPTGAWPHGVFAWNLKSVWPPSFLSLPAPDAPFWLFGLLWI